MADSFLETYANNEFSVLVQAEVASISQKAAAAKQEAARFAAKAAGAPPPKGSAPPWRRAPPEPANPPSLAKAKQPSAVSLPVQHAVQADAMQALHALQGTARPIAPMAAAAPKPPAAATPAASKPPAAARPAASKPLTPALPAQVLSAPKLPATVVVTSPSVPTEAAALPKNIHQGPPKKRPAEEDEVSYLRRRLHNTQRSGRNRLYYQVLNLHGPAAAAKYWVPPVEKAKGSSSGSSNSQCAPKDGHQ